MEFYFQVMEFISRFWKNHKSDGNCKASSCKTARFGSSFKSCTLTQGYRYVRVKIEIIDIFHHIPFEMTPNLTWNGESHPLSLPWYTSVSCHKSCKRSLNFQLQSLKSHGKIIAVQWIHPVQSRPGLGPKYFVLKYIF